MKIYLMTMIRISMIILSIGLTHFAWSADNQKNSENSPAKGNGTINLSVDSVELGASALVTNQIFPIMATILNTGSLPAPQTTVHFLLSTDDIIAPGDFEWFPSATVTPLPAGKSSAIIRKVNAAGTAGNYWVGVCIDPIPGDSNPADDCSAAQPITVTDDSVPLPPGDPWDLTIDTLELGTTELVTNQIFPISATATNIGGSASQGTGMHFLLSTEPEAGPGDFEWLPSRSLQVLLPDDRLTKSRQVNAPGSAGTYWVTACIDTVSGEAETANNCAVPQPITVTDDSVPFPPAPLNLTVSDITLSTTTLVTNQIFSIMASAVNNGTGPTTATTMRFLVATDDDVGPGDFEWLPSTPVASLQPGESSTKLRQVNAPGTAGNYWVTVCIDKVAGDTIPGDDCSVPVQINVQNDSIPAPEGPWDIIISQLIPGETTLVTNQIFPITATANNIGTGPSQATKLHYLLDTTDDVGLDDFEWLPVRSLTVLFPEDRLSRVRHVNAPGSAGTYWISVCADTVGGETNPDNNCAPSQPITVLDDSISILSSQFED